MRVLFISNVMSKSAHAKLASERTIQRVEPSQKFFDLIVNGMAEDDSTYIKCLSVKPLYRAIYKKLFIKNEKEIKMSNLEYEYVGFVNYTLIKQLSIMRTMSKSIKRWCKSTKGEERVIVVDPMLVECTHVAIKIAKKKNIKVVSFVTDIPSMTFGNFGANLSRVERVYLDISNADMPKFDAHIVLVEQMNEVFNKQSKPQLVIESVVPSTEMSAVYKDISNDKFEIMYAGKLHEKFGLAALVDSMKFITNPNIVLNIYGDGDGVDYIKHVAEQDSRIKYHGVVSVTEIEKIEQSMSLLINPRPTDNDFTKYSFPSKTVEYMLSGTPFASTRLQGIPDKYFEYIHSIEDESAEGMAVVINKLSETDKEDLASLAENAKQFVLDQKNNIVQGKKINIFIKEN